MDLEDLVDARSSSSEFDGALVDLEAKRRLSSEGVLVDFDDFEADSLSSSSRC